MRERRRVIDAVARHRHQMSLPLQLRNDIALVARQHLCAHIVDAELRPNRDGGRAVVAGEHDHRQPFSSEKPDGFG